MCHRYRNQIRDLINRGAPISGIGFESHLGPEWINLQKVEMTFDLLWNEFHIPMWITEFDWNGNNGGDHSHHAEELDNFYRLCLRFDRLKKTP